MNKLHTIDFDELDRMDTLAPLRSEFDLEGVIYLDGNSLGPLPVRARKRITQVITTEWGRDLIRSWNTNDWINLPRRVGAKIAPLIGAAADEVIVGDSTSVCLFKLAAAALKYNGRRRILTDSDNFPTDLYILAGLRDLLGDVVEIVPVPRTGIAAAIDENTALVTLTHVDYKTSHMVNLAAITAAAHHHGALILWDLSHSAGAVPVQLNAAGADLAVGCTYKYLNGGPGSPAFSFVSTELQGTMMPVLRGWMGHAEPFSFSPQFAPAPGIQPFSCGTPEVLALSVVDAGLDVFSKTSIDAIREKSALMSDLFIQLVDASCSEFGIEVASPREAEQRGSHVALRHHEGYAIMQALIARGIVGDFRAPDLMRFGFAPLYQRFADIRTTVNALYSIMQTREWDRHEFQRRSAVT